MKKIKTRDLATFLGFVMPGLALYLFIVAYPIIYSVFLSFTNYNRTLVENGVLLV